MARMTMNTYEIPLSTVGNCNKCGYEASTASLEGGVCAACKMLKGVKLTMPEARFRAVAPETVTSHGVRHRCLRRFGCIPEKYRKWVAGEKTHREIDLPKEIQWDPNCLNPKRKPRPKDAAK